jgi:hypothetical protein
MIWQGFKGGGGPFTVRFLRRLQTLHQFHDPHPQRVSDDLQRLNGHIALAAFDFSHMSAIQTGSFDMAIRGLRQLQSFLDFTQHF